MAGVADVTGGAARGRPTPDEERDMRDDGVRAEDVRAGDPPEAVAVLDRKSVV